ncbi:MAG: hypothetical protein ABIQ84_07345 [Usitatibacter sp.]
MNSSSTRTIRLTRAAVFSLSAGITALMGTLCSTAALAAGVESVDTLAIVFAMGAAGALFALIIWYLLQLRTPASRFR